jgi:hypothetical protein
MRLLVFHPQSVNLPGVFTVFDCRLIEALNTPSRLQEYAQSELEIETGLRQV